MLCRGFSTSGTASKQNSLTSALTLFSCSLKTHQCKGFAVQLMSVLQWNSLLFPLHSQLFKLHQPLLFTTSKQQVKLSGTLSWQAWEAILSDSTPSAAVSCCLHQLAAGHSIFAYMWTFVIVSHFLMGKHAGDAALASKYSHEWIIFLLLMQSMRSSTWASFQNPCPLN